MGERTQTNIPPIAIQVPSQESYDVSLNQGLRPGQTSSPLHTSSTSQPDPQNFTHTVGHSVGVMQISTDASNPEVSHIGGIEAIQVDDDDDKEGEEDALATNTETDDHEEDEDDDLSSDPPPQRSDGEWTRINEEINEMEVGIHGMDQYEVIDKLGEGTFSSVYKAVDKNHFLYDNFSWTNRPPGPPMVPSSKQHLKPVFVALKRIYVTSSPQRILNELELMEDLRNCQNVAYLITAFRTDDQIVAVMPYSRHADFRVSAWAIDGQY